MNIAWIVYSVTCRTSNGKSLELWGSAGHITEPMWLYGAVSGDDDVLPERGVEGENVPASADEREAHHQLLYRDVGENSQQHLCHHQRKTTIYNHPQHST